MKTIENQRENSISSASSPYCCISHAFHRSASNNPTKKATIIAGKDGEKCFTFSELLSAVDSLSFRLHHILNGGDHSSLIKPTSGKILGVYMVPSAEYVVTILSILRLGLVFLPLDPNWPKERILSIVSSSNVDLIIGFCNSAEMKSAHLLNQSHWLLNCKKFAVLCVSIDEILEQKCGKLDPLESAAHFGSCYCCKCGKLNMNWPCEGGDSRLFSYLMYTSGSTGKPKGVCGTEEGILNRFLWMQELYPLKEDDVLFFKTSISFIDHIQEFLAPMLVGCTLVVPSFAGFRENLYAMVDFIQDYSITRLTAVPSLMRALVPALEGRYLNGVECSLKLLILSGEVFPVSLWRDLSRLLPRTCILNIYGSTEVSGDCTYFDCERLVTMLDCGILSSVPIGLAISSCEVKLIGEDQKCDEGEIVVKGVCLATGYFSEGSVMPFENGDYRTGDFARRLPSGDLVFLGRKDRTIKVNGQRIALEEVEETIREHPSVTDAAVIFYNKHEQHAFLRAILVLENVELSQILESIIGWVSDRLPSVMIPKEFISTEAVPRSSTGKVDYTQISNSFASVNFSIEQEGAIEHIKGVFGKALNVTEVGVDDDLFVLGGDSLVAAHVAYKLGIDMRLLYMFPTPSKLLKALIEKEGFLKTNQNVNWELLPKTHKRNSPHAPEHGSPKRSKIDVCSYSNKKVSNLIDFFPVLSECTFTRCNKVMYNSNYESTKPQEVELLSDSKFSLFVKWRVSMDSCVDASPIIVFKDKETLIFIGSHSHKFVCVNVRNGSILWQVKLEGRIECSAMIDGDFSQVVVGCYQGKIYFIDILSGTLNWSFQTGGEVKSQPVVDKCRNHIWCGSYDHNLYAFDYRNHRCVHKLPCGGSIFGSPAIDDTRNTLYVGTTNGRLTAVALNSLEFSTLWLLELESPIFGSLSISQSGNVICGLVNGDVLCLDPRGSRVWKVEINGPIFAGPCISSALNSQALVCSRNGIVYSFEMETGRVLWEHDCGDPITASAFVDENIQLTSGARLVCICTSSGIIQLLKVSSIASEDDDTKKYVIVKIAEFDLQGDVFSSPVMVGGRIFVGCRDDYLHCIAVEAFLDA